MPEVLAAALAADPRPAASFERTAFTHRKEYPPGSLKPGQNKPGNGGRTPAFDPIAYNATRFDKRDFVWRGAVDVASIRIWLRDLVP